MRDRSTQRRVVWWVTLLPLGLAALVALTGFAAVPLAWAMAGIEWLLHWLVRVIVTLAVMVGAL
jgi:hypothetical protein